ncbi:hypothetical protein P280DRAFT_411376 [Massarina eburnea CBS 473.64]|uniref:Zn(2)-C6 fungal-type domain-containing protein n=1 Tax=Massarina eburnea CBS 473.64 TaxID=1395130 RepID=A0A6A6RN30_9PLEO|nr:hypothetical protein P280DRAFT_411376 [Massarina eburnea CBS 473.64]
MASPASSAEQHAAKRKSHRKSRNGCFQCKQRHTKCNEQRPRCANCVRLDIECTWPSRQRYSATTAYPTPPESDGTVMAEPRVSNPDVQPDTFGSQMSMADLRLLHHWTTKTCRAMSLDVRRCEAWETRHTEMALDYPFLLRGMLAVAAMHKVIAGPMADRSSLLAQADAHISRALATYRQKLEEPTADTAVPMFLLSAVLVIYNLAAAQLETTSDSIAAMTHCIGLIHGVVVVARPHWEQVTNSQVFRDLAVDKSAPVGSQTVPEVLRLKSLIDVKNLSPEATIYIQVVDDLHLAFQRVRECAPNDDTLSTAFTWTSDLPERFMQLLLAHDPISILILAHFATLIHECWESWWLCQFPQKIVLSAQKLLMTTPELLDYLDWPLQIINDNK